MPAVHGDRVCRRLVRGRSPSHILMLTAATDVEDRVDGLELGALGRRGPGSPAVVQRATWWSIARGTAPAAPESR